MSSTAALSVEISPGELLDKLTILEIKSERIDDATKLRNVRREFNALIRVRAKCVATFPELDVLTASLKTVNESLWDCENRIRDCERERDFGPRFIELARSVYRVNDERASLKREINKLLNSSIVEEKSYADYSMNS